MSRKIYPLTRKDDLWAAGAPVTDSSSSGTTSFKSSPSLDLVLVGEFEFLFLFSLSLSFPPSLAAFCCFRQRALLLQPQKRGQKTERTKKRDWL